MPPVSPEVNETKEPGVIPQLRRVVLLLGTLPLKRICVRLDGMLDLEEISSLRSPTVAPAGTLIVIVCPSSIFTRIWTSVSR